MSTAVRDLKVQVHIQGDKAAEAGIQKIDKAIKQADQTATQASSGGLSKLNSTLKDAGDKFKKSTDAVEAISGSLARVTGAVGLATLAFSALSTLMEKISEWNGKAAANISTVTDEMVRQKTGLTDLTPAFDSYARSIGYANGEMLTWLDRRKAMLALERGGGAVTIESLSARQDALSEERKALVAKMEETWSATEQQSIFAQIKDIDDQIARASKNQRLLIDQRTSDQMTPELPSDWRQQLADFKKQQQKERAEKARAAAEATKKRKEREYLGGMQGVRESVGATVDGATANMSDVSASVLAQIEAARNTSAAVDREWSASMAKFDADYAEYLKKKDEYEYTDEKAMEQFKTLGGQALSDFGQGMAQSAANALLFGESFEKGVNQAMKALAAQAAAQALWEGAQAIGSLATGNPAKAALHGQAAALYAGVAAVAAGGAAMSGGLRSGQQTAKGAAGSVPRASDFGPRPSREKADMKQEFTIILDAEHLSGQLARVSSRSGGRATVRLATQRGV